METIQQAIVAVILNKFPGCDILPAYEPETGLHIFQMIFEVKDPSYKIIMPPGFLMTQIHVKNGKQVVFEMMIHQEVFKGLYPHVFQPSSNAQILVQCYA